MRHIHTVACPKLFSGLPIHFCSSKKGSRCLCLPTSPCKLIEFIFRQLLTACGSVEISKGGCLKIGHPPPFFGFNRKPETNPNFRRTPTLTAQTRDATTAQCPMSFGGTFSPWLTWHQVSPSQHDQPLKIFELLAYTRLSKSKITRGRHWT